MTILETVSLIVERSLHEPHAGVLLGILFGTKATLSPAFKESLLSTGTIHIIALSGMNITLLVTFVQLVLLRFFKRSLANIGAIVIIIGFISIVGVSASVVRAAIMGCISLFAANVGRKNVPLYTLVLAVVGMLLLHPPWVTDIGFQLSVLATLGIILFAKKEKNSIENPPTSKLSQVYAFIEDDLRVTLAAQVFTIPLILFQFHRLSLIAPLSNVLIGWLIAPIMITGFVLIGLGLLWLPLAQIAGFVAWVLISILMKLVDLTAKIPFSSISF